jgi:DNA replication licensing factor MCM2
LRQSHINCLVRVCGVVTRRSGVFPALKSVVYDCDFCGTSTSPLSVGSKGGYSVVRPSSCTQCQKNSFKINSNKSEYENYQKINLQESPGSVSPGRVPRYKEVILLGDLIDIARPGEEIEITGIYVYSNLQSANYKSNNIPVFSTVIDANSVVKKDGHTNHDISEEDKRNILKLSKEPKVRSCEVLK